MIKIDEKYEQNIYKLITWSVIIISAKKYAHDHQLDDVILCVFGSNAYESNRFEFQTITYTQAHTHTCLHPFCYFSTFNEALTFAVSFSNAFVESLFETKNQCKVRYCLIFIIIHDSIRHFIYGHCHRVFSSLLSKKKAKRKKYDKHTRSLLKDFNEP